MKKFRSNFTSESYPKPYAFNSLEKCLYYNFLENVANSVTSQTKENGKTPSLPVVSHCRRVKEENRCISLPLFKYQVIYFFVFSN